MKESHQEIQDIFNEFHILVITEKIKLLDSLLYYFTITGSAISSDELSTDAEKVEAFKWLNELVHRIWNIRFELMLGDDNDFANRLLENMKFYSENSKLFRSHLKPAILGAYKNLKANPN